VDYILKAQCRHTITYAVPSGLDSAGQVIVDVQATYPARVEPKYREVHFNGAVERTSHMIIVDEGFPITIREARGVLFWLPEDDPESDPGRRAKEVKTCTDEFGLLDHWEILV
jgi:hypothetical protein